jgi:hypothetical protein
MSPVVALVSSGDESAFKEYIHPRASLMAALGRVMRGDTGVILCTELAAFFAYRKQAHGRELLREFFQNHSQGTFSRDELVELFQGEGGNASGPSLFESFERTNVGIVHVRTDGALHHSGERGVNEAYRFAVASDPTVKFDAIDTQ